MHLINTQALPELGSEDLLIHHVPVTIPYLELTNIFPGNPKIRVSLSSYCYYSLPPNKVVACFIYFVLTLALLLLGSHKSTR
jgi:hypothetical protein